MISLLMCMGIVCSIIPAINGHGHSAILPHAMYLDNENKFHISWDYDQSYITFNVEVETHGYIGLGFSATGGMIDSDIVIGWVDHQGKAFLQDRYAATKSEPQLDANNDYTLLDSLRNDTHTSLRFKRRLSLCDGDDLSITGETIRLIWAYNQDHPSSEQGLMYHGANRGVKSVFLLNPVRETPELPEDIFTIDFLNNQTSIPSTDTTYWCESFLVPQLDGKKHVIKVEPVIEPGRELEVHHLVLRACYHKVNQSSIGIGHQCYYPGLPADWMDCHAMLAAWAIGGTEFYYPENVGFALGDEHTPTMVILETHYDNPRLQTGLQDSSGFRLTLTSQLRRHDAGLMLTGSMIRRSSVIPPYSQSFRVDGHCMQECLSEAMVNQTEVNIFAVFLHSHLAGRQIRLRHFRNGEELAPIAEDKNYDFNFQETRRLEKEIELKRGDNTITECFYQTTDRTTTTHGGLGTKEEMCMSFVLYYPKIPLSVCLSAPSYPYIAEFAGVSIDERKVVTYPAEHAGKRWREIMENEIDWSNASTRRLFQDWSTKTETTGFLADCQEADTKYTIHRQPVKYPRIKQEYHHEKKCISGARSFQINHWHVAVGFVLYEMLYG